MTYPKCCFEIHSNLTLRSAGKPAYYGYYTFMIMSVIQVQGEVRMWFVFDLLDYICTCVCLLFFSQTRKKRFMCSRWSSQSLNFVGTVMWQWLTLGSGRRNQKCCSLPKKNRWVFGFLEFVPDGKVDIFSAEEELFYVWWNLEKSSKLTFIGFPYWSDFCALIQLRCVALSERYLQGLCIKILHLHHIVNKISLRGIQYGSNKFCRTQKMKKSHFVAWTATGSLL